MLWTIPWLRINEILKQKIRCRDTKSDFVTQNLIIILHKQIGSRVKKDIRGKKNSHITLGEKNNQISRNEIRLYRKIL